MNSKDLDGFEVCTRFFVPYCFGGFDSSTPKCSHCWRATAEKIEKLNNWRRRQCKKVDESMFLLIEPSCQEKTEEITKHSTHDQAFISELFKNIHERKEMYKAARNRHIQ
jgi:hypothetical protein